MVTRKRELYVEGGGDRNPALASECRKAFSKLFEKAGITQKPKVIACGGRKQAYDQFCTAFREGDADVWLLVDAEEPVRAALPASPWDHVKTRRGDGWDRPEGATDEQLHLMHVCMETWLVSDGGALREFFGPKLDETKLPALNSLEQAAKQVIYDTLAAATKPTPSGKYGKGAHSFGVLALVSPQKIRQLTWGARFLNAMGATS